MNAALQMYDLMTLQGIASAIGLPALEVGALLLASQAGPTAANSGQAPRRASRSALQVKEKGSETIGIYGPTISDSSKPAGPMSPWVSKCMQRFASIGSTECLMTWKELTTPARRSLYQLVPSTRHSAETGCGSSLNHQQTAERALWITASARDWKDTPGMTAQRADGRSRIDQLPRPVAALVEITSIQNAAIETRDFPTKNVFVADTLAGLSQAQRHSGSAKIADHAVASAFHAPPLTAALWPTPTSLSSASNGNNPAGNSVGLVAIRQIAIGMTPTGSSDTTAKRGASPALNPAFVCWLMGFPLGWLECVPAGKRQAAKSRLKASETPSFQPLPPK